MKPKLALPHAILEPTDFADLSEEVEEQACTVLSTYFNRFVDDQNDVVDNYNILI